ncbi:MAG: hypothetical protein ACRDKB_01055 [Actinomycetota bacterium]
MLIPVAAAVLALFFVGRDTPGPSTNARPAEGFALTDAEAIAKFEELNELRLRALRERDPSLLSLAFTPDSPAGQRVAASIRRLTRDSVLVRTSEETEEVSLSSNDPSEILLLQTVVVTPRFIDEQGKDVTQDPAVERWTVEWTLHRLSDRWLIHDAEIIESEPLRKDGM